tara:strand:- start:124 stop:639 length:516 start_codon:yes stop_codon:yes gene_type:complete
MNLLKHMRITLIGMAGVGKTTFGEQIALENNYEFIDIDTLINNTIKTPMNTYIKTHSEDEFLALENSIILNLKLPKKCIISTGGSAIYCKNAMTHLKKNSTIVFLTDNLTNIKNRIPDLNSRGIITKNHTSFEDIYNSRLPLYKHYQDITVNLPSPLNIKKALSIIYKKLS